MFRELNESDNRKRPLVLGQISSDLRKQFQDCGVEEEKGIVSYRRSKANGYELRFLNFH